MRAPWQGLDRESVDDRLDRVAWLIDSEAFAIAFGWGAVLVALAPLCLVYALGYHTSGAFHVGVTMAMVGIAVGGVAAYRLVSIADHACQKHAG